MTLILLAFVALSNSQQSHHDEIERSYSAQIHYAGDRLFWQESTTKEQRKAFHSALKCYSRFHLYKVSGCSVQFETLKREVAN